MASLTTDVLTLTDEVGNYFGGDYEEYGEIELTLALIEKRFRATGIVDGKYQGKLVLLTQAQLDVLDAALNGFSPHGCSEMHTNAEDPDNEHGDESECFGYGPKALADLSTAHDIIASTARED